MGKVLVLYYSEDGHTEKMARLVTQGAGQVTQTEVRCKSIADASRDDIFWCDGLALGSPTQLGTVAAAMKKFWEELLPDWQKLDGRIGCAFSSQGGWGGGAELTCQALLTILMNFGFLVFGVTDYVGDQFTAHYGATQAGEPREAKEKEACQRLGRRLAEWIAVYADGRRELHPLKGLYKRNPWD
ncbi:flavodoxin family protein [candidate division KSB1 bacterium]|nr:flavodoxin family protein [candidate division KSB1 bacterium]